jgi:hypothetical protein
MVMSKSKWSKTLQTWREAHADIWRGYLRDWSQRMHTEQDAVDMTVAHVDDDADDGVVLLDRNGDMRDLVDILQDSGVR